MLLNVSGNENVASCSHLDKITSNSNLMKNIVLSSKGEISYMRAIDLDEDGIITMAEFSEYCSKNGVSDADKQKLFAVMQMAKSAQKFTETEQSSKEDTKERIYARLGDEKYDKRMDENHDLKVTYEEYLRYCLEYHDDKDSQKPKDKIDEIYNKKEEIQHEISVEIEA